jgi:hypothetical protein
MILLSQARHDLGRPSFLQYTWQKFIILTFMKPENSYIFFGQTAYLNVLLVLFAL